MIFQHYIELIHSQRWQIGLIILLTTSVMAVTSFVQLKQSPEYTAAASVMMLPSEAELQFSRSGTTRATADRSLTETYIEYVKSRPVVETAIERVKAAAEELEVEEPLAPATDGLAGLIAKAKGVAGSVKRFIVEIDRGAYVPIPEHEKEISEIQDAITVSNIVDSQILRIQVTLPSPDAAALMANTLAEAYVERISDQINADANELEKYLQDEVSKKESQIQKLRDQQARIIERFGAVDQGRGSLVADQMRVIETQLAELHSRLLTINLSRASATTQVRLIEPALSPAYPSSPRVVRTTAIGLFIGIMLSIGTVVIRDSLSEKIKTTTDLRRVVGIQGIGLLQRKWVRRRSMRALGRLGVEFQRHLAAVGFHAGKTTRKRPRELLQLVGPTREADYLIEDESVAAEGAAAASSGHAVLAAIGKLKKESQVISDRFPVRRIVQVTGFMPMDKLCWATVGISASFASMGNKVYCKIPDGHIKRLPRMRFKGSGELVYDDPDTTQDDHDYVTIQCIGPMNVDRDLGGKDRVHPIICVLPRNEISEQVVDTMAKRLTAKKVKDVYFILMAG